MTMSHLSMLTLAATVALIVTAQFARRNPNPSSTSHRLRKILAVMVLGLAATYFYMRFTTT